MNTKNSQEYHGFQWINTKNCILFVLKRPLAAVETAQRRNGDPRASGSLLQVRKSWQESFRDFSSG